MTKPQYTNVRMNANTPEGEWWLNQSDRDYAMKVLIELANQKFGKNTDLKQYSVQQMVQEQPVSNNTVEIPKPKLPLRPRYELKNTAEVDPSITEQSNSPKLQAKKESKKNNNPSPSINDALFGDDSDSDSDSDFDSITNNNQQPHHQSFRDKL